LKSQKQPRGKAYAGECYFRIRRDPETNVGIDIAIATPEQAAATSKKDSFVDGPPLLAVEVLSPYDKSKDIHEMIEEYLDCGIAAVWIVDPYAETVAIHRRDREPQLLTRSAAIDQQPELPGFTCTVAELFQ
jgi:Uma2 family endonuclease